MRVFLIYYIIKKLFTIIAAMLFLSASAQEDNFKKTDEVLAKAVEKGLELAEKTGSFVIEQAPDLLQEFYRWHIWSNVMGIVFGITLILVGKYVPYLWLRKNKQLYDEKFFNRYGEDVAFSYIIFGIGCVCGLILLFCSIYELVFILTAPKLYLIEYFVK